MESVEERAKGNQTAKTLDHAELYVLSLSISPGAVCLLRLATTGLAQVYKLMIAMRVVWVPFPVPAVLDLFSFHSLCGIQCLESLNYFH